MDCSGCKVSHAPFELRDGLCLDCVNMKLAKLTLELGQVNAMCDGFRKEFGNGNIVLAMVNCQAAKHDLEWLWNNCKIVYFPSDMGNLMMNYIEHNRAAMKPSRSEIEAYMNKTQ